jgi:hypothetical protein
MNNISQNHYNENLFIKHCQSLGLLEFDFMPLGETRGGDRTNKDIE